MWQKKQIDKVTKLGMLYEAPLELKNIQYHEMSKDKFKL